VIVKQPDATEKNSEKQESADDCSGDCAKCAAANPCETEQQRQHRLQQKRLEERAALMRHQILIISGKGGVGKSTVAANLAWALAAKEFEVGLLDADLHGPTIPLIAGVKGHLPIGKGGAFVPVKAGERFRVMSMGLLTPDQNAPIIWRGPLRANVIRQLIADVEWGRLDFFIVDLPPGTGDEPLTVAQAFPKAAGAIVVSTPQEASLADCRKAVNFVRAVELPVLGVIENMSGFVCPHCGEQTDIFGRGGAERMAAQMGVPFLGAVPLVPDVVVRADRGQSLVHPEAPEASRRAFEAVVDALMSQFGVEEAAAAGG